MQDNNTPVAKDLVLIGGGHSHVAVLKRFGMRPVPGLRLTLITRDIDTPYSGMLPGLVAGHYGFDQCHIDLGPLARFAGARLYHAEVEGIDLANRLIHAPGRPPIGYDLLSINTGSRPNRVDIPGVDEFALAAKPIDIFLQRWQQLIERVREHQGAFRVVIVGGGAGGVELALSTQVRLTKELSDNGRDPAQLEYRLLTRSEGIMPGHSSGVRRRFERIFGERGIEIRTDSPVTQVAADHVVTAGGEIIPADAVIWVTSASAPGWLRESGLAVDDGGFVRVDENLRCLNDECIFAAGDVASLPDARPKSGVFAVRQGGVLAGNLRAAATGGSLRRYRAQKRFLGLISTGDRYAVASYGNWSYESSWLWRIKDWIDQRFMRKFTELPQMDGEQGPVLAAGVADGDAIRELSAIAMRCGGCGAKVGATVLSRVMQRLPETRRDDVLIGRDAPDDCAMLVVPEGKVMVQSVDYFRAFIDDAYTFGAIAANHALGDVFAMGAEAQSALAIATVPYGRERVVEETLHDMLAGALSVIEPSGAVLAGGHSSEGAELAFGLSVNGLIDPQRVWRKQGLKPGNALVLTKPIGTGTLFAAEMRGKAKGRWVDAAIQSMLVSNLQAARCLQKHAATACTDLTGFGLVGHLLEMTKASGVDAVIERDALPLLDGALDTVQAGILSSLQPQNLRLRRGIRDIEAASRHPVYPLLFDPQTAGGLLAGVPEERVADCLDELHRCGYPHAAVIGRIEAASDQLEPIRLQ
jgi:selenide,water dikinase